MAAVSAWPPVAQATESCGARHACAASGLRRFTQNLYSRPPSNVLPAMKLPMSVPASLVHRSLLALAAAEPPLASDVMRSVKAVDTADEPSAPNIWMLALLAVSNPVRPEMVNVPGTAGVVMIFLHTDMVTQIAFTALGEGLRWPILAVLMKSFSPGSRTKSGLFMSESGVTRYWNGSVRNIRLVESPGTLNSPKIHGAWAACFVSGFLSENWNT
mmetsp:Transcript_7644/g.18003  ORF Transcript_7644/g.18003 Transcript_7644/m.18003 type:complete len:215 (+) Transcript_7644:1661-2305(+)